MPSVKFLKPDLYYPVNDGIQLYVEKHKLDKIVLNFEINVQTRDRILHKLYEIVSHAIAEMSDAEQQAESERFFVYLISDPRPDVGAYLRPLLRYFHMIGYLRFKKHVYNTNKQKVVRYRVIFKNSQDQVIKVKHYSSLAQLSDDTGKKMTSLHYQLFKVK